VIVMPSEQVLLGERETLSFCDWKKEEMPIFSTALYNGKVCDISILQAIEGFIDMSASLKKLRIFIREKKFGPHKLASLIPSVMSMEDSRRRIIFPPPNVSHLLIIN
jgi:hypothetical protein